MFGVAKRLLVVGVDSDSKVTRKETRKEETEPTRRAKRVAELVGHTLICGTISPWLEAMLVAADLQVIPHTCGLAEQILNAFSAGRLAEEVFLIPGCSGRRRGHRGREVVF